MIRLSRVRVSVLCMPMQQQACFDMREGWVRKERNCLRPGAQIAGLSSVVCLFAKPHVISMAVSRGIPDKVDKCGDSDPGPPK